MWNKSERTTSSPAPPPAAATKPDGSRPGAVVGQSISVQGDLKGDEDLRIDGRVEGRVTLRKHLITVGKTGRLKANVEGKSIYVEGEVHGDLVGQEEVVIRASGKVEGNIRAPRVILEHGCQFRGSIDMETQGKAGQASAQTPSAQAPTTQTPAPAQGGGAARPGKPAGAQTAPASA